MHTPHPPCDTLLTASVILTQDKDRTCIEQGAIAITQGRVAGIGSKAALAHFQPKQRLDLGQALIMPGLVNAHTHVAMTFLRGFADDLPLLDWLSHHIFPVEQHLTKDIVYLGSLLGCAEMTRTGTTAFADMYLLEDAVCGAVTSAGLKALVGEVIFSFPSPAYASTEAALALVEEQAQRYAGHPLLRVAVMPHTVYTTTPALLQKCRDLAQKYALPLHIHLGESAAETALSLSSHNKRPVALCRDLGLLGPRTTIAHAVDITAEECDWIATSGTKVAHNPKSNLKLASGVAPVPDFVRKGMLPGLGTDGAASNNTLNMFAEMTQCALIHKGTRLDPTLLPAQTVLDMATLGSAAALHWDGLGSLHLGGPADLIALDLTSPNLLPLYTPASHLVYAASGHEVRLTMVDGTILYQDGTYTQIDYPTLLQESKKLHRWVLDKHNS